MRKKRIPEATAKARQICRIFGHRLQSAVHARKPTLYCGRCFTVCWIVDEESGLILDANATISDLRKLGLRRVPSAGTSPDG